MLAVDADRLRLRKVELIHKAKARVGRIVPLRNPGAWSQLWDGRLMFWYSDRIGGTTMAETEEL
jgi:hypothetical protein